MTEQYDRIEPLIDMALDMRTISNIKGSIDTIIAQHNDIDPYDIYVDVCERVKTMMTAAYKSNNRRCAEAYAKALMTVQHMAIDGLDDDKKIKFIADNL